MKKVLYVILLVALLLSLTLTVVLAGEGMEDPAPPGYEKANQNGRDHIPNFVEPPGNAGRNWVPWP